MISLQSYILEKYNNAHKGDEFYTRLVDIEKELKKFDFKNKVVYCNCDNPSFSKFYKYFKDNFSKLGLKQLIATYYDNDPKKYVYDGKNENIQDIESGDFRNNEDTLKTCDIVVTNPPFSKGLPTELANLCIKNNKDFLFLCKNDWYTRKGAFDLYKAGKVNIDNVEVSKFDGPNSDTNVTCYWFTSLELKKDKVNLKKSFDENVNIKFKNYDAINVPKNEDIPNDYDGNMGVPISFGKYLNRSQFEVVDILISPIDINGKNYYKRLIIKRK